MGSETGLKRILVMVCALSAPAGLSAHHSTAVEFDPSRPVTFTGTVQKVTWRNPHIYTHVEVKQPDGTSIVYNVEGGPPNSLVRQGWRKESLKVGTVVKVSDWRARNPDSRNVGHATLTAADGRELFSGGPAKAPE